MKQKPLLVLSGMLTGAVIGIGIAGGADPQVKGPTGAIPAAPQQGVRKPAEKVDAKPAANAEKKPIDQLAAADHSADEDAIQAVEDSFAKAYKNADPKAAASHFTTDAEYIDEQGNVLRGRKAIEEALAACFAANPKGEIRMDISSIRILTPGVAVEDGTTTVMQSPKSDPVYTGYTAVHVKADGKWLIASVRENTPKDRRDHRNRLKQLAWLQGDWVDEGKDSVVHFTCQPIDGGNFLLRKFTVHISGHEVMSGTQRIGWDPLTSKFRAWIFDSEGGYADGFWHRDEDRWVLKSFGVTADGEPASSTSIYTFVNENTMTWQSVDHEVAGVELPDSEVVTMVRRAPLPEAPDETQASNGK